VSYGNIRTNEFLRVREYIMWRVAVMAQENATEDHDETSMSSPIAKSRPKRQSTKPKYLL